ncbi:MAG: hypothetical protein JWN70_5472 [Planctomycetaceae bacterium]|nr:hypothetical protein [Planctomycetaceae bacterium]
MSKSDALGESGEKLTGSKQGPFGMTFGTWLRFLAMRPPMDLAHSLPIALCTACSISNSVNRVIERAIYGRRIDQVQFPGPALFVLGHWRSGTTYLHTLLSQDPRFVTPNTYQIINPHHFLLTESTVVRFTKWLLPKTRPMDNMKVSWESPQEDETALLNLTLSSPYIMLAFQGQPEYYDRYFEMRNVPPAELERWKRAFLYFVKKLTVKSGRQILLKSPTHTFRIPRLLELFPDAHFVNIVRNPYAVYSSTIHMRRQMLRANSLTTFPDWDMEDEVCHLYRELFERYHRDKDLIPSERLYEIRYEDLERSPVAEIGKLYDHFGWTGFAGVAEKLETHLNEIGEYQKNHFRMDSDLKSRVYDRFHDIFNRYGYPKDLDTSAELEPPMASPFPVPPTPAKKPWPRPRTPVLAGQRD